MGSKRRVFVSLHHRNALSIRENRQRLHYAAYHWGILISPKSPNEDENESNHYAFDVSDNMVQHPTTTAQTQSVGLNTDATWHFRAEANANPDDKPRLLGRVMIGKLPNKVSYTDIHSLLEQIPLPQKGTIPEQNCVTWTRAAICTLQEKGLAEKFDLESFMDKALAFADHRLREYASTPSRINYTTRRM